MPFLGTIVNCLTIVGGSILGMLLSKLFSKNYRLATIPDASMKAISVFVMFIGIKGAFDSEKSLVIILSLVVGTVIGTAIGIDELLERFGAFMERKFVKPKPRALRNEISEELSEGSNQKSISKGFVTTTVTCCVGALAIIGSLNSGLSGGADQELLYTKAVLDLITAIVFASAFGGIGSMLAAIPLFIYQGAIELCAGALSHVLVGSISEISATGSLIVIALGLNMMGATKIKIANMLPAIFLPILFNLFM